MLSYLFFFFFLRSTSENDIYVYTQNNRMDKKPLSVFFYI